MKTKRLLPFLLVLVILLPTPGCTQSGPPVASENPHIETRVQTGHAAPVSSWRFSPDGRYLLTGASRAGEYVWILWDTQTGTQLRTRCGPMCDMSPDGRHLLILKPDQAGSYDVVLESTITGRVVHTLLSDSETKTRPPIFFSRDGRYVVVLGGGANRYVWETATGEPVYEPGMPLPYSEEELERLRKRVESFEPKISRERANDLSTLLFLKRVLPDGKPLLVRDAILTDNYTEVSFSPDGSRLVGREWYNTEEDTDETVIWDVGEAVPLHSLRITNRRPSKLLHSGDGERIICGTDGKTVQLIDGRTFEVIRKFEGHEADITQTAVSPAEKRMLSGDKEGVVILWDVDSGKKQVINERQTHYDKRSAVTSLAFTPSGDRFLVGHGACSANAHRPEVSDGRRIEVHETDTAKRQLVVRGDAIGRFDNGGSWIVTETAIRDAATGKRSLVLGMHFPCKIEMSSCGKWALSCPGLTFSQRRSLWARSLPAVVWNTKTAKPVYSFEGGEEYRCAHSHRRPRTTQMPATSTSKDPIYDLNQRYGQGEPYGQLAWKTREAIAENKDLDAEGKAWLRRFVEPENPNTLDDAHFRTMAVSPTGRMLATRSGRMGACPVELRTSDAETLHSLKSDNRTPTAATFSQDESQLLVACFDDNRDFRLTLWDTKTGEEIRTVAAPKPEHKWVISKLTLSLDKQYAAICIQSGYCIHLVDLETGESFCMTKKFENYSDIPAFFSPDGKRVFCFGYHRTLWDIETKKQLADFGAYNDAYAPIFSPNGTVLLVQNREHGKAIWNTETGELIHSFANAELVFSPDGTRLVAIRHDRHPHELWDFQSGKKICDLASDSPEAGWPRDAFFSPDGNRLVTTYDNELTTWDIHSGKPLTSFVDDTLAFDFRRNLQEPFFLSDGKRFVTVHAKGAVVWDLETGRPIHRFATPIESKTEAILAPDGETLLVVTRGREAKLWDLKTGEAVQTFSPLPRDTEKLWFGDDGTRLFSRHQEGQAVFMWDVPSGEVEAEYYLLGDADKWLTVYPRTGTAVGATEYLHEISHAEGER